MGNSPHIAGSIGGGDIVRTLIRRGPGGGGGGACEEDAWGVCVGDSVSSALRLVPREGSVVSTSILSVIFDI